MPRYLTLLVSFLITSCDEGAIQSSSVSIGEDPKVEAQGRWYTREQVLLGAGLFSENCAVCHGEEAQGIATDWKQRLEDGSFPPPPLNGTAHAWHHPNSMLLQVINEGGASFGGKMPAFSDILEDAEKFAVISYFQNFWTDEIYDRWELMGGTN